jgi:hypothetical protein
LRAERRRRGPPLIDALARESAVKSRPTNPCRIPVGGRDPAARRSAGDWPSSSPSRFLLLLPVLAIAFGTPVFADLWYESYTRGEDALNQRNWKVAIDQFTQAIEKKGDPGVVSGYGMNFINYHPYLKLGIAYYNLGQLDAVVARRSSHP